MHCRAEEETWQAVSSAGDFRRWRGVFLAKRETTSHHALFCASRLTLHLNVASSASTKMKLQPQTKCFFPVSIDVFLGMRQVTDQHETEHMCHQSTVWADQLGSYIQPVTFSHMDCYTHKMNRLFIVSFSNRIQTPVHVSRAAVVITPHPVLPAAPTQ